jgi:hypothetical protein
MYQDWYIGGVRHRITQKSSVDPKSYESGLVAYVEIRSVYLKPLKLSPHQLVSTTSPC